jgi:CubicO group peptidase (beta-lactamase class C family)
MKGALAMNSSYMMALARPAIFLIAALLPITLSADETRAQWPPHFDSYAAQLMRDWSIPGAAIAIVRRDEPNPSILSLGLRQWDRTERIDEHTMFGIASITKTFVAAGIGLLVQDGKVRWDDPVVRHLPDFKVQDPWITREVTLRDLLSHRSGVASYGDFLEEVPGLSEAQLVTRLALHEQSTAFRAGAEYNNYAYVVLAQVIERVSGQAWGEFLRARLWRPLGMGDTYAHADDFVPARNVLPSGDGWSKDIPLGLAAVPENVNVAAPHVRPESFFRGAYVYDAHENKNTLAHFHRTAIDPSQSVFASVADMSRWARVLMEPSTDQSTVLNRDIVRAMRGLTSVRRKDWPLNWQEIDRDPVSGLRQVGFGLGLEIYSYGGRMLFGHSGGELGYNSLMVIDPTAGFAVIALVNNAWRTWGAEHALVQTVLDWQYGSSSADWSQRYLERGAREHEKNLAMIKELLAAKPSGKQTFKDLEAYAGTYTNPLFGPLRVSAHKGRLRVTTGPTWEIELDHWGQEQFRGTVISPLRLGAFARFAVTQQRSVDSIELEFLELWGTKFRFERERP